MAGSVHLDSTPPIATITFGGTKGNSMPGTLLRSLAQAVVEASDMPHVRVIVLRSLGDGPFCAGASFDELAAIENPESGREFFMGFARVILAMVQSPRTIVCRVQGKVVGGGVGLVAACDYAIASDAAAIRLSELAVGIGPFVVGPAIERKVGPGALAALTLDADWRSARWAERHGLYARVIETAGAGALDDAVETFATRLASSNPAAIERIKRITWRDTEHWPQLLSERAALSGSLVLSPHARDAIAAFRSRVPT